MAVSGGGDSVALLHLTADWVRTHTRPLVVLHVDHGLNPDSAVWRSRVEALAQRLGAGFRSARWEGPFPQSGLPAAARAARHAHLADMAREAGARVILTGHTADDVAEGEWMKAEAPTLGTLRDWSPSPAWPEGRGLMMLRPLLGERRADLRHLLQARGEAWMDDPANTDPRFLRSRARVALADRQADIPFRAVGSPPAALDVDPYGVIRAPRALSGEALAFALVVAGGGDRLPRGRRLAALRDRLASGQDFEAGLVGARLMAGADSIMIVRETGNYRRTGEPRVPLVPGRDTVWDGRFALMSAEAGWTVVPLAGRTARLEAEDHALVRALPAAVRPGLPVLVRDDGTGPVLAQSRVRVEALAEERLALGLGQIVHEADLKCRREWRTRDRVSIL
nr:tRNA lysidine(34) synthetase TilS [Brevundimonas sp. A19_0]